MSFRNNDWHNYILNDFIKYSSEKIDIEKISEFNYISTENMLPNKGQIINASSLPKSKTVTKYSIGDTLISNIRPYFKKIWFANKIGGASNDVLVIKSDNALVDKKFLYYLLSEDSFFDYVMLTSKGTKMPRGDKGAILNYKASLPPLKEQKAIAKILSDLDEKIEVNNKINKNLEEMAQAIFKQWFVDFEFPNEEGKPYKSSGGEMVESELGMIPKGFKVKSIGELPLIITDYVANGSFKSLKENVNMYDEINYAIIVRNTDLKSNFKSDCKYVDKKSYDFLAKSKLFGGELIISNVGDVGSIYLCPKFKKQMTLGSNLIMIDTESSENIGFNLILYRFFKSYIGQYYIKSITGGSAQPKFNKTDFKKIQFINPSNSILKLYNEKNEVIESIIMNNVLENERLEKLRDTLLPKLMSGEIRVPLENNED
ncbi:restriction endonuclease subunit S [Clostridium perfringens]